MTEFGSFSKLFDDKGLYLTLLNLHTPETSRALEEVKKAGEQSPDIQEELSKLFCEPDWRPHLVAAATLAFIKPAKPNFASAWEAFDQGSWVCPQLAAVLALYDKNFKSEAIKRLILGCLSTRPMRLETVVHQTGHPSLPHYVVEFPKLPSASSADLPDVPPLNVKNISALTGLLADCPDPEIKVLLARPETLAAVAADADHGNQIATQWKTAFQRLVQNLV